LCVTLSRAGLSVLILSADAGVYDSLSGLSIHSLKSGVDLHGSAPDKFMGEVVYYGEDETVDNGDGQFGAGGREAGNNAGR